MPYEDILIRACVSYHIKFQQFCLANHAIVSIKQSATGNSSNLVGKISFLLGR